MSDWACANDQLLPRVVLHWWTCCWLAGIYTSSKHVNLHQNPAFCHQLQTSPVVTQLSSLFWSERSLRLRKKLAVFIIWMGNSLNRHLHLVHRLILNFVSWPFGDGLFQNKTTTCCGLQSLRAGKYQNIEWHNTESHSRWPPFTALSPQRDPSHITYSQVITNLGKKTPADQ